ncbi:MAG: penicillin acylase family protein [Pseudomonadota bacterium]
MRFVKWGVGLVGVVLLGLAIWLWDPLIDQLDADAARKAALQYDAEIIRDDWGVPHIFGQTRADTAFGLGYAHAEDDFETIQEALAATRGVLARYRGAGAAPTDYIVSLFGVWDIVDDKYERDVPADVKATATAYVDALNLYAVEHPEKVWPGLTPFRAEDVIAGFVFRTPFFYGLDGTLLKLFGDEYEQQIALDPAPGREAWHVAPKTMAERGSNAFAVAPARSGDGVTRLIINSHQPMTGPVAWYEAHLVAEDGLDITGGVFPGAPIILHGFNQEIGWANTVSNPDLSDVYVLERNPENELQYRLDGEWRDFEVAEALIKVKLFGPFAFKAKRRVLTSAHGPVIEADHGTYALRYAGMGEIRQLEQYMRLNTAKNLAEFEDAMSMLALPSINYIYADREGNIGFFHNGQYPNRDDRWDWSNELPGDRSDLIWEGYRPWADVPKLINPQSGLIFNANNQPYDATDGSDNLRAEDFPQSMGLQTDQTNRSLRIMELTDGVSMLGRDELLAIKFDTAYSQGSLADEVIDTVLATDWSAEPDMAAAAEHLAAWDYHTNADNRHAALGALTALLQVTARFTGNEPPEPADAFRRTVSYLIEHYGRIDPEWGEVNRLVRGDVSLPISGGSDILRAIYPAEIREDGQLHASAGDTWIAFVEWDEDRNQSAEVIHQFGSATLDKSSPHYADQAPLFAEEKWRRALLSRDDIEAAATRSYRPGR